MFENGKKYADGQMNAEALYWILRAADKSGNDSALESRKERGGYMPDRDDAERLAQCWDAIPATVDPLALMAAVREVVAADKRMIATATGPQGIFDQACHDLTSALRRLGEVCNG